MTLHLFTINNPGITNVRLVCKPRSSGVYIRKIKIMLRNYIQRFSSIVINATVGNNIYQSNSLLPTAITLSQQIRGFKMKRALKRLCADCYFEKKDDRLYVLCKTHPRHKQMQIRPPEHTRWILTHATQGKRKW